MQQYVETYTNTTTRNQVLRKNFATIFIKNSNAIWLQKFNHLKKICASVSRIHYITIQPFLNMLLTKLRYQQF